MTTLQSTWEDAKEKGGNVLHFILYPAKILWSSFWDVTLYGHKRARNVIRFLTTGAGVAAGWYNPSIDPAIKSGISYILSKVYGLETSSTSLTGASQTAFPFHAMWFGGLLGALLSKWAYQIFTFARSRNGRKITNSKYLLPRGGSDFRRIAAYYGEPDDPTNCQEVEKCLDGLIGVIKMFKEHPESMKNSPLDKEKVKEYLQNYINGDPSGYYEVFVHEMVDFKRVAERQQRHQREWYRRVYGSPEAQEARQQDIASAAPPELEMAQAPPSPRAESAVSHVLSHSDSPELSFIDKGAPESPRSSHSHESCPSLVMTAEKTSHITKAPPSPDTQMAIEIGEEKERTPRSYLERPPTTERLSSLQRIPTHEYRRRSYLFSPGPFGLFKKRAKEKADMATSIATLMQTIENQNSLDRRADSLYSDYAEQEAPHRRRIEYNPRHQ